MEDGSDVTQTRGHLVDFARKWRRNEADSRVNQWKHEKIEAICENLKEDTETAFQ